MALVPALDLREEGEASNLDNPHSIEAEQALLGSIMFEPDTIDRISIDLKPEHFYEPVHARLYKQMRMDHEAGRKVEPAAIWSARRGDKALKELGGIRYLADLIDHAPPSSAADTYAQAIHNAFTARQLIDLSNAIGRMARNGQDDDGATISSTNIIALVESAVIDMQTGDPRLTLAGADETGANLLLYLRDRTIPHGIDLGLAPLRDSIGILRPKEVMVIAGRPSMGKSALGCHLITRVADPIWWAERDEDVFGGGVPWKAEGVGVIEINGEMSKEQMTERHIADIGHELYGTDFPSYEDIRNKNVGEVQMQMVEHAVTIFGRMPIKMLKRSGLKVSQLRSICRRQAAKWAREGITFGLLMVDHVGLLRAEGRTSGRYEAQTEVAMGIQQLADDLNVPVLALVQLNREVDKREKKRPQLSDLRDAGAWEENADVVIFPFRDAYYAEREDPPDDGKEPEVYATWLLRKHSKWMDIIVGKKRAGKVKDTRVWAEMSHNAIRSNDDNRPREGALV